MYRLEQLRTYLELHLGASIKESAHALDWSYETARDYTRMIRNEWKRRK